MVRPVVVFSVVGVMASAASGCTFLVTFDSIADAACEAPACADGSPLDATVARDHAAGPPADGDRAGDEPGALRDVSLSADVGDCALIGEGNPCGKPDECQMVATCHDGVCTPNPLPDGTSCGAAPDMCHAAPGCKAGVCAAAEPVMDGTPCGTAPDACHDVPTCVAGACSAAVAKANGTVCGKATDACHSTPTCASGACGASAVLPDSTNWNKSDPYARCCGGKPVETTTTANCGVCGWSCGSGQTCTTLGGEYVCAGCTTDGECSSNCCSTDPTPNHCSPGNCKGACQSPDICPDGSHCVVGSSVDYCTYE